MMARAGIVAAALAASMMEAGMVKRPKMVEHAKLEQRFDGPDLAERIRGAVGAGHITGPNPPAPKPCTFVRKPGKRAMRRARAKSRALAA